jgi:hypothetical protein
MERSRVREKIKEEFLAVLPPTLFFFVALHLDRGTDHVDDELAVLDVVRSRSAEVAGVDRVAGQALHRHPLTDVSHLELSPFHFGVPALSSSRD